jgi:hypothetical protein
MKNTILKNLAKMSIGCGLLALSAGAAAYDWQFAIDDIESGDFGQSAGFELVGPIEIVPGDEYYIDDQVCVDFEVSVEKSRTLNPAGRGRAQEVIDTDTVTYCQMADEPV